VYKGKHARVSTCVLVCVYACVHVCVRVRVYVCVCMHERYMCVLCACAIVCVLNRAISVLSIGQKMRPQVKVKFKAALS
jgi:hypothetical protein